MSLSRAVFCSRGICNGEWCDGERRLEAEIEGLRSRQMGKGRDCVHRIKAGRYIRCFAFDILSLVSYWIIYSTYTRKSSKAHPNAGRAST